MLVALAEGLGNAGRWDEAFATLTEAIDVAARTGEAYFQPEAFRLRGEFMRRQAGNDRGPDRVSRLALAEDSAREALALARRQEAKSLELRAAVSLCLVQRDLGNHAEGYRLLMDVMGSFTEGLGTADLREAAALAAEMGSWT
jgi:hypothetical protein